MTTITCDRCQRPISGGYRVSLIGYTDAEAGDPTGEFCSTKCLADYLGWLHPTRRPDFAGARGVLAETQAKLADVAALEDAALRGEYDDVEPEVFEGAVVAPPPYERRNHAFAAADTTARISASRVGH